MAANQPTSEFSESEERYRRLVEAVSDYIFTVRVERGQPVETLHGPKCVTITGYAQDEFAANPLLWIAMVPLEDRPNVEQQAADILAGRDVRPIEHRIRRKDGRLCWVLNTPVPHYDAQGSLLSYTGLVRDITKRKEAEESLQKLNTELEQRVAERTAELQRRADEVSMLTKAVANLGEGVLITDGHLEPPGPHIMFVNEAMCRVTGYNTNELIGQSPRILQGERTDRAVLQRVKTELTAGRPCRCELVNYRKDGTAYDAELFITPLFDGNERRTNFVSIHRDITEQKRSEQALRESQERMRAVLNTAADAIITIDQRGIIQSSNLAAERMFGYSVDEMIGHNVGLLMPSPHREKHDEYIARYLQTRKARIIGIGREVTARRKDGSTFPVDLAVNEIDHLRMFTGIVRDISDRKELQRRVLDIATEEQRRIGQDLHDSTQQELTGLGLMAQHLHEELGAKAAEHEARLPEQVGLWSLAEAAAKLATGVAEANRHVRLLSRGLVPVEVEPQGLMAALAELAKRTTELHGVACRFQCAKPVEIADVFLATHLYRIAQEAVTNALKHAQADTITISLQKVDGAIRLCVLDNGIGITDKRAATKGLGLEIMAYRAGLMGGTIQLTPGETEGTLVTCMIPGR
jgi:PAS domain S-box-containing protein